jgi:hypothetical protein
MWIGIDPGKSGALAYPTPNNRIITVPLPLIASEKNNGKSFLDGCALHQQLMHLIEEGQFSGFPELQPRGVIMEEVTGLPGQSAHGAFIFGMTCGIIYQAAKATGLQVVTVTPQVWRAKLGVHGYARRYQIKDTKEASCLVADQLWPEDAYRWAKSVRGGKVSKTRTKADHAEAALLSEYGRRFC